MDNSNTTVEETCESDASIDRLAREKDLMLQDIERSSRMIERGLRKKTNSIIPKKEIDEFLEQSEIVEAIDMDSTHLSELSRGLIIYRKYRSVVYQ